MPLANLKIIITGANKGIGYAIVKGLISMFNEQNSCNTLVAPKLILAARNLDLLNTSIDSLQTMYSSFPKENLLAYHLDLMDTETVISFAKKIQTDFGKVDV